MGNHVLGNGPFVGGSGLPFRKGIWLFGATNRVVIDGNVISDTAQHGILAEGSTNQVIVTSNQVINACWGGGQTPTCSAATDAIKLFSPIKVNANNLQ